MLGEPAEGTLTLIKFSQSCIRALTRMYLRVAATICASDGWSMGSIPQTFFASAG